MKHLIVALVAALANGDGTVTDRETGLLWQQKDGGEMTWEHAQEYCSALSLGGKTGWRLPSNQELFTILDHRNPSRPSIRLSPRPKRNTGGLRKPAPMIRRASGR